MSRLLLTPQAVRELLARRFVARHRDWLSGDGDWPMAIALGMPTEKLAAEEPAQVRAWADQWARWSGPGQVSWQERLWGRLGSQRLPASLLLDGPGEVAALIDQSARWETALQRYRRMTVRWPALAQGNALANRFDVLADYDQQDFDRLHALLEWADCNHAAGLSLRQLPIEGLHTKWLERRSVLVASLLRVIRAAPAESDLFGLLGVRRPPHRVRIRLLCDRLRQQAGGLADLEAPLSELASLPIEPRAVIVVENLETGLALQPRDGVVCIMKLGLAAVVLGDIPWVAAAQMLYWGDIDTHGMVILGRARQVVPGLRSVLMDEATLLRFRPLCTEEPVQSSEAIVPGLDQAEQALLDGLRAMTWGQQLRLEQERIPMEYAERVITAELSGV